MIVALLLVIVAAAVIAGLTFAGSVTIRHVPYQHEFCFAEWCVTPTSYETAPGAERIDLQVRSDAKAASQRPDHPQAWLVVRSGEQVGGPQPGLDRLVGPGEAYDTTLVFTDGDAGACPHLLMSEGAWPSFTGLGYAPSPFTERVDWPLCG